MSDYKTLSHCKYLCQYHLIWCPKFRFDVLNKNIQLDLKNIFTDIANKYEYEIIKMETMEDYIHLFVGAKPTVAPTDIVRTMKSISAIELFKCNPKLKKFYGKCGSLWSKGKFISSIGNVSAETVKNYIEEQKR